MSLKILSPVEEVILRDFPLTDSTLVDPQDSSAFEQGMWFSFDQTAGNEGKIVKGAANATVNRAFPAWSKKGEPTTQALTQLTVIFLGEFMADTDQFDETETYTVDMALTANADGILVPQTGAWPVRGYVMLPPDSNNGLLRVSVSLA